MHIIESKNPQVASQGQSAEAHTTGRAANSGSSPHPHPIPPSLATDASKTLQGHMDQGLREMCK